MVDVERLHELGRCREDACVEPVKAGLHGAALETRAIQDIAQTDTGPQRIAHRAVAPLSTRHALIEESSRVAGALVHRRQFNRFELGPQFRSGSG